MILDKEVQIKINISNRKHFTDLGYENLQIKKTIVVPIEKIMKKSGIRVNVECDICGIQKYIMFKLHKDPYFCKKCGVIKMKKTKLERYGTEKYVNFEKAIETKIKKYGSPNHSEQIKKSVQEKYGVDNVFQLKDVKDKIKLKNIERYGFENVSQNGEIKKKKELTFYEKYDGCLMGSKITGDKIKKRNMEKYGFENVSQNEEIKKKKEQTVNKNYGGYHFCTDKYKSERGILLDRDIINKWILYKRKSRIIFHKIKKEIFKNWDGFDYYDNEYIKENLNLPYNHRLYPTVDHKTSVYFGFMNNISIEEINDMKNLVVTKRCINSSKGIK